MIGTAKRVAAHFTIMGLMAGATVAPALAGGSIKDEPMPEGRKLERSFNIGITSDYVFRGISQRTEDPALQGGIDLTYGIFYVGAWASMIDFGPSLGPVGTSHIASTELDLYAGIKPVWGPATFDFGIIYYLYPGAKDSLAKYGVAEQDFVEFKAGVSGSLFPNFTSGTTVFFSPEFQGKVGNVWTIESTYAYELPKFGAFTPTLGAVVGAVYGDVDDGFALANGDDSYMYWNAGLSLNVDALTLDFRYWDTDISNGATGFCKGPLFACDERFVASAKVTF